MPYSYDRGRQATRRLTLDHELFEAFARHLVHEEGFDAEDLLHVIERPHRWTPEFEEWKAERDLRS
jgi:hypothetical protein